MSHPPTSDVPTSTPPTADERAEVYIWRDRFPIASMLSDPIRWNSDWENALRTLPATDVFKRMGEFWKGRLANDRGLLREIAPAFKEMVHELQSSLLEIWTLEWEGGPWRRFQTAWLLLEEEEQQQHLRNALIKVSKSCAIGQDARALCPDITSGRLSKINGRALLDFIGNYHSQIKATGQKSPFLSPSAWWAKASPGTDNPNFEDVDRIVYEMLTFQREEFICQFARSMIGSIVGDIISGGGGMGKAKNIMQNDPIAADFLARMVSDTPTKPIVRCENCTKSQEELKGKTFMICSACQSKLNFPIHYCSPECQKQDWRRHKKHCGKERVSKKLKGTIHDPQWAVPDRKKLAQEVPEWLQEAVPEDLGGGIGDMGFPKPHPSLKITPALRRQMDLYTSDRDVEYFLFDDQDRPVPFFVNNPLERAGFRMMRSGAIAELDGPGVAAMAQYIIKHMSQRPGFNRELLIRQFEREYGDNMREKLRKFENIGVQRGIPAGSTFIEYSTKSMDLAISKFMGSGMGRSA